jgi:hypothetical protein
MTLPRVRFTVRRMMVAVAVVGPLVGLMMRHLQFRRMVAFHDSQVFESFEIKPLPRKAGSPGLALASITVFNRFGRPVDCVDQAGDAMKRLASRSAWHEALRRKFEYAATHPWLPVAPDPPEPE